MTLANLVTIQHVYYTLHTGTEN